MIQSDSEEYQAACKLWGVYLQTRNEFVQPGDGDDEDDDGDDVVDNPGTEYEVSSFRIVIQTSLKCTVYVIKLESFFSF